MVGIEVLFPNLSKTDYKIASPQSAKTFDFPSGQLVRTEAYDLLRDPAEKAPLDWEKSSELKAMNDDLDRYFQEMPGKVPLQEMGVQDPEMMRRLRALGYIH